MEKFIMAGGCAVRIRDSRHECSGTAQAPQPHTIVLLHGYLESLDIWDGFSRMLEPSFRVISLDLPGHGISEISGEIHTMEFLADTVHAALETLEVGKCVMIGHSMGGYAALEFLRKYPQMLAGIILFHSTPDPDTEEKKENRKREIDIVRGGKKELLFSKVEKLFSADNRKTFGNEIEEFKDQIFLTEDEGIIALLNGMCARRDNNETLLASKVPQMFIFGAKDEHITVEAAETLIKRHPQARVVWLCSSGHMGFMEEPGKSVEAVIDFCRSLDWK